MNCCEYVKMDLEFQERLLRRLVRRRESLAYLEGKYLTVVERAGKRYFYETECINSKELKKYLNSDMRDRRHNLQELKYLDMAIANCRENIENMKLFLRDYRTIEPAELVKEMGKAYQEQKNAMNMVYGISSAAKWRINKQREKADFEKQFGKYRENEHKHISVTNTPMMSKSEVIMENALIYLNIPYVYEVPMIIGGKTFCPDFIVLNTRTKQEFLFEHIGYFVSEDYRERYLRKLTHYIENGYIPNVNLLLTYEDMNGDIDVSSIYKLLKAHLR